MIRCWTSSSHVSFVAEILRANARVWGVNVRAYKVEWWKERFMLRLSHSGSTGSDVAVCGSPRAHTRAAEMTLAYSCVSQSKQQLFTSKSASLESGSKTVFGWNYIDRVSSTTGVVRRGTLCLSSLYQPLLLHKEPLLWYVCQSHCAMCVNI